MKKIFLIILFCFIISGCDAIYTVELKNGIFNENLEINNYNKKTWDDGEYSYSKMIDQAISSSVATDYRKEIPEINTKISDVNYYNINKLTENNNLGLRYQADFSKEEYKYSTLANENTLEYSYNYNNKYINIKSGIIDVFAKYHNLNNLTIKFKTNHNVLENNADELKDGTYLWHISQNNYQDKNINLKLSSDPALENLNILELDDDNYFGESTLIALYIITGLILLIIGSIIFFKVKNSNR